MSGVSTLNHHAVAVEPAIGLTRTRRKFLRIFPKGFADPKYLAWERNYKWDAHERWTELLNRNAFRTLLAHEEFETVSSVAVRIESRTNLLFSFEKMALRDAVRTAEGSRLFATGLFAFLHGSGAENGRFAKWCEVLAQLPRKQTRVLTWPVATVFGFIAAPGRHFFLKPNVTRRAAALYGFDFEYVSKPDAKSYAHLLSFANAVKHGLRDLQPRDMIDIQSFLWVQGSDEYD